MLLLLPLLLLLLLLYFYHHHCHGHLLHKFFLPNHGAECSSLADERFELEVNIMIFDYIRRLNDD
jgi:hypothetical protein